MEIAQFCFQFSFVYGSKFEKKKEEKQEKWEEFAWCAINSQFVLEDLICLTLSAWFTNRDSRQL